LLWNNIKAIEAVKRISFTSEDHRTYYSRYNICMKDIMRDLIYFLSSVDIGLGSTPSITFAFLTLISAVARVNAPKISTQRVMHCRKHGCILIVMSCLLVNSSSKFVNTALVPCFIASSWHSDINPPGCTSLYNGKTFPGLGSQIEFTAIDIIEVRLQTTHHVRT
jgi:hypothetical protein